MQIKFNFNSFISHGVSGTAWQRASGIRCRRWRLLLAYPIMASFHYVPYVACVALDENPAYVIGVGYRPWYKKNKFRHFPHD